MKFSSAFIVASFCAVVSAASVPTTASIMKAIMDDFTKLSHLYAETVVDLNNFPQSGVKGANVIHDKETTIESLFADAEAQMQALPTPVSEANAKKIITTYQDFTPTIIQSLNGIAAKAPSFISLKAAPTMSNDLTLSANSCRAFATTMLSMTPPAMLDDVNAMFDQLTAAREAASSALASIGV